MSRAVVKLKKKRMSKASTWFESSAAFSCLLFNMSFDLNLDPHTRKTQGSDPNASKNGPMVWRPLLEVSDRSHKGLLTDFSEIQADLVDLRPAGSAGILETVLDIGEGAVDFLVKVCGNDAGLGVPASCTREMC